MVGLGWSVSNHRVQGKEIVAEMIQTDLTVLKIPDISNLQVARIRPALIDKQDRDSSSLFSGKYAPDNPMEGSINRYLSIITINLN